MDTYWAKFENEAMLKHLIDQLSQELWGGEPIAATEDGSYTLQFESDLDISLKENFPQGVTMLASVAPSPTENKEEFLLQMMSANLLGRETGGSVLGLSQDGGQLILTHHLSVQANYREFRDSLEDFINYAESWRLDTMGPHEHAKESD